MMSVPSFDGAPSDIASPRQGGAQGAAVVAAREDPRHSGSLEEAENLPEIRGNDAGVPSGPDLEKMAPSMGQRGEAAKTSQAAMMSPAHSPYASIHSSVNSSMVASRDTHRGAAGAPSLPSPSDFTGFIEPFLTFLQRLRRRSFKQVSWVVLLIVLVMIGNFLQIVMLNFWLISFPADGAAGNYTAFAVPGIFYSLVFLFLFGAYVALRRPSLSFATNAHGWLILLGVGFCDTFNSWMATYAASYTSEVLQALFTNLCPLFAVFLSRWILHDTRSYTNVYIISVFVLTIVGILTASLYGIITGHQTGEGKMWILIFFLSMPLRVLMNVFQSLYMIAFTHDPGFLLWLHSRVEEAPTTAVSAAEVCGRMIVLSDSPLHRESASCHAPSSSPPPARPPPLSIPMERPSDAQAGGSVAAALAEALPQHCLHENHKCLQLIPAASVITPSSATEDAPTPNLSLCEDALGDRNEATTSPTEAGEPTVPAQALLTARYSQGEDTIVKLVMLAGETTIQMCFSLALLPADALPWWGNSATVGDTWGNFGEGIQCIFTIRDNFMYFFFYTCGFVLTYVGCAYLNHYSAPLCTIISQLSSPVTALVLVVVPRWNVQSEGDSPWYLNLIAIVLLSIAAFIYAMWEELTGRDKTKAEYELKLKELYVLPPTNEGRPSTPTP